MSPRLEFFWDVSSPYTYLASTQLDALAERTGAEVVYRPFLLGGVFKATGNVAPAVVPARAVYLSTDLDRWRKRYGVPMKLPLTEVVFPINSVLAMRVATAVDLRGMGKAFCHAAMRAYWEEALDVSTEPVLREVLTRLELDPDAVLAEAASQQVKDALRAASDEAVARGAFGAPAMFVDGALYFGNDRLDFVEAALTAG
ncbi:MAG: 2-hydroxychromene-2-carboxylate isomerase [Myxococcales bacterium]|nr:2-hydroxychromene-2-carboxylate isomerase [Myxococcales bacterium]MCB9645913.1 2-hydroxychromene-2-carboxylate isomerase [Deltaproteobacteria bacterium]